MSAGERPTGADATVGRPRLLASVGPDVLVLDDLNNLWRLRAVPDGNGRRTLTKVNIPDNRAWGVGSRAIAGFMVNSELGLYQLYVVVPAMHQIVKYPPAPDGSGFPAGDRTFYFNRDQDVSGVSAIYVDGHFYVVRDGKVEKYSKGAQVAGWRAAAPDRSDLRLVSADNSAMDEGDLLLYDAARGTILEIRKSDGALVGSFVSPGQLADATGLGLTTSASNGRTLYWLSDGKLLAATLPQGSDRPGATSGGSGAVR
jgi:hypothetical protein